MEFASKISHHRCHQKAVALTSKSFKHFAGADPGGGGPGGPGPPLTLGFEAPKI